MFLSNNTFSFFPPVVFLPFERSLYHNSRERQWDGKNIFRYDYARFEMENNFRYQYQRLRGGRRLMITYRKGNNIVIA